MEMNRCAYCRKASLRVIDAWMLAMVFLALSAFADMAFSQAVMIAPYHARGYAGPLGSDLTGDPVTVSTVFQGRDFVGTAVEAVVPVEMDPVSLDAAFNYATFNPTFVDTSYLRPTFADLGVTDIDGDGIFSQIAEISGLPVGLSTFTCLFNPGSVSYTATSNPIDCFTEGMSRIDSYDGYDFLAEYTPVVSGGTVCRVTLTLSVPDGVYAPSSLDTMVWRANFSPGGTVNVPADCGTVTAAISYETYDGPALLSLLPPDAAHLYLGDVLAVAGYNDDVAPFEWADTAADLTAQLEDEEGPCYEAADCIYVGAYQQTPIFWREGYSFSPGADLANGGGGGGLDCSASPDIAACEEIDQGIFDAAQAMMDEVQAAETSLTTETDSIIDGIESFELGEGPVVPAPPAECPLAGGIEAGETGYVINTDVICDVAGGPGRTLITLLAMIAALFIILRGLS